MPGKGEGPFQFPFGSAWGASRAGRPFTLERQRGASAVWEPDGWFDSRGEAKRTGRRNIDDVGYGAPVTTVLLFHHALGRTAGFLAFADGLREAGHTVLAPDLFDGNTFRDLDEGVAFAEQIGFPEIIHRGSSAADELPTDIVYAGFSLGVLPAQSLAQTRRGGRGALLYQACVPPSEFGSPWPEQVPVQVHMMDADPWTEEDLVAARAMVEEIEDADLFLYPGSGHLFADPSSDDYSEQAAGLLEERTLTFLRRVG